MTAGGGVPMYTEICVCAELGETIAPASSAPSIQFHLIVESPSWPSQLPCSTERQVTVNEMRSSANTQRCMRLWSPRAFGESTHQVFKESGMTISGEEAILFPSNVNETSNA